MILPESQAVPQQDEAEQADGKLAPADNAMMRTVMEADSTEEGKVVNEMMNNGMSSFQPDLAFSQMTQNYQQAKQLYGETLLAEATGYDSSTLERNMNLPEFQREIKSKLAAKARDMEDKGIINRKGEILETGYAAAAMQLYIEEVDTLIPKGLIGEREHKEYSHYGGKEDTHRYRKGDSFKDIAMRQTVKQTIRHGKTAFDEQTIRVYDHTSKGQVEIIYALDASGSMKGKRIRVAKRAGVALAYKATQKKDKVGLMVFAETVKEQIEPTTNFLDIIYSLAHIRASKQTDIAKSITKSIELFSRRDCAKHLIFLTDAAATVGENPTKRALDATAQAVSQNITISVIGIDLDEETTELAQQIAEVGKGKLYVCNNLDQLDRIILEDYARFA